ncbi:uncharacterized protein LOC122070941 isoform X2 [Macadamia integrifolia]|uniref:uncharacterized protein LOC122070941 isoform X2 n=1 Tax=Macadamia integrifolia TaxID=60698 RepID=UPI001C4ECD22|nr:uncharacterized protein LOC122070941 isoform X2 [Macadamia integrifolia]
MGFHLWLSGFRSHSEVEGMSSQTPTTGDRSRTYWTPSMERYFIDLMLDQMHRGNKIGHTFNKQAWTDMLTWFNAKFESQYDKDVLKSRYTNLWKQFNDVKILLEQSGFAWDEARQMVTADDFVWDSYIKVHPDARSYKTKTLLNYNDLFVIFGYATADGRYSRSSHDVDNDDDLQAIKIGEGTGTQAFATNERSRTDWTPPMDLYFIDLMLDQLKRGNKIDHTFNKQAWTDMVILFNEKFSSQYGKRVLRHRYKKLWKYCNDIAVLLEQNGFCWDEIQHRVTADDDVWDAYIKAHPHARSYRTRTFPNYKDLCLIYGNGITGGRCSHLDQEKDLEDDAIGVKTGDGREREREVPTSTDRSRTYWTPPMDRYFIELLLEQVNAGNKIGHTFITQAWVDMVTSFNEKFGSQLDKDVLKNRYKHLRRQYKDITVLIEQSRFSWDETRQMVTADDHVWDAYIKEHPDARSYRIKTVPNYNSLCLIYGKEITDGRYSRLAHDTDFDNDFSGVKIGNGTDSQATASSDRSRTDWTPSMDRYFIDLMLEQVQKGNKFDNTFNKQAWTDMITLFNAKFGSQHDKDILRSRYKNLRKQYNDMKLLQQNGFTWDETRQMVKANDDVWDAYIKEHPDARSYRTKTKSNYVDLCVIYGNSNAEGRKLIVQDIYVNDEVLSVQTGEGKDGEAPTNTDRSRTDWTPPMDHYFIDLMLDQVHRGNMIDHKFNKEAWTDMITLFNANFGSLHDKDVLRSRYKNLRKRYNDMKMLLDHGGFAWDEARHIITAADDVWDAYIKKCPNARSYRTKTMPNYKDLCLIYGNVMVEQRRSSSGHAIGSVDDILGVLIEGKDDEAIVNSDCLCTDWTPPMYHYFIDLMLEQVQAGNKIDHAFNEQAWMHMITLFNAKFSYQYSKDAFESQYDYLRKQYNDIMVLLNQDGFSGDDAQKRIIADNNHWNAFIQAHPGALQYRTRILEKFKDLSVIYGNGTTDGGDNNSWQHVDVDCYKLERENGGGSLNLLLPVMSVSPRDSLNDVQESSPSGEKLDTSDQKNKRQSVMPTSSQSCWKVQRTGEGMIDALSEMADVVTSLKNREENKNFVSIENVISELQAVPDIDDELLLDACDLLEDEKKAKTFLALDVSLRKKWLLRKLRP